MKIVKLLYLALMLKDTYCMIVLIVYQKNKSKKDN